MLPAGAGDRIDAAVEALWATLHGPLFTVTLELWIAARTNADLREAVRPEEHRLGAAVRDMFALAFGPQHAGSPRFAELSTLLWSSMRGIALTYTFEQRDPRQETLLKTWKTLARSYLEDDAARVTRDEPKEDA